MASAPPLLLSPDTYPKVQLALTYPLRWNTQWENVYTNSPHLVRPDLILGMTRMWRERAAAATGEGIDKQGYALNYETTCEIQTRLGIKVLEAFTHNKFEAQWANAPVETRRYHVLKSLANGGAQAKNLNMARAYCSDILKLDHLSADGQVLLALLREVTPADISIVPKEPYWFRCPEWDEAKRKVEGHAETTEEERFDLMEVMVLRTKLIYLVLEGIVDSFYGRPLPKVTVFKTRDRRPREVRKEELRKLGEEYKYLYGEDGQARLREDLAALDERKSQRQTVCSNSNCRRTQDEGEKFMRCGKCWTLTQRTIMYCGKDCQVEDWKSRHKQICGVPLSSVDSVLATARTGQGLPPPAASQFPAPTNGFKRTPQLVMHIRLLDSEPDFDFMLRINSNKLEKVTIPNQPIQELFRAARYKAFVEGDKDAYAEMCHFLIWFFRARKEDVRKGWDLKYAVEVMEKEFAFPELKTKMKECQDRQWEDELRRPPLVASLSDEIWNGFVTGQDRELRLSGFLVNRRMEDNSIIIPGLGFYTRTQTIWSNETH